MGQVNPSIFAPATSRSIEKQLRDGIMPSCFVRRMRVLNLISATTLMKAEDELMLPFDVMDLHHVLDRQISQDAIIDQLDSEGMSYALETGNLSPLWDEAQTWPLLRKAFHDGWIQRFFWTPMDPICIMLAMRTRLLLDLIDELGHSYNLLRMVGWGFIDFGEIPGETPGDPGDYYDPGYDVPIDYPAMPGPGDPGYVPGPGDPGYVGPAMPPGGEIMPGAPGYIMPGPGDPGYTEPGGDVGGAGGAMHPPSGMSSSPGDLGGAASPGGSSTPPTGDPCADVDDPTKTVSFSYTTKGMGVDETQEFAVTGNHPRWSYEAYEWKISGGGGSMARKDQDPPDTIYGPEEDDYDPDAVAYGFEMTYTAPPDNPSCEKNPTIELWCGGELMASLDMGINAYTPTTPAYYKKVGCCVIRSAGMCSCYCGATGVCGDYRYENYSCDGSLVGVSDTYTCTDPDSWPCDAEEAGIPCETEYCPEFVDHRHPLEIVGGCCPAALI